MAAEQDPEGRAAARPLLTDLYQATMALGYWRAGRARDAAEFELFFRRCPFGGAFALAAGLRDCVRFLRAFRLRDADVQFLASVLPPDTDPAFFEHLRSLDCSEVTVRALPEGCLAFPGVPLLQVSGPLLVVQLLETPLLCLVSYASLVATNAARLRLIAGPEKRLLEMGLRRAQGPDGGLTASTYSYLGGEGLVRGKARAGKEEPRPGPKSPNPTPSSPGFDSSSNVLAGQLRGVPVAGTLAHSFVTSFSGSEVPPDPVSPSSQSCRLQATDLKPALALGRGVPPRQVTPVLSQEAGTGCITFALKLGCPWLLPGLILHSWPPFFTNPIPQMLAPAAGEGPGVDLAAKAQVWLEHVCAHLGLGVQEPHPGERAAFVAYALAFPRAFQGLLDSYSVRRSGLPNFLAVALALGELGYRAVGVRLDSGDLLQQAQEIRKVFRAAAAQFQVPWLESVPIAVSNNIDEEALARLAQEGSEVNVIGIGTSVVTCPQQPSLGCVYKLVAVGGQPRMKLTEDPEKQTLPGSKAAFRLLGSDGSLLMDVLQLAEEPAPQAGQELRVWPPGAQEPCTVRPAQVEPLLRLCLQQGQLCEPLPSLAESRALVQLSLSQLSPEHRRLQSPAQYQVVLSERLQALVNSLRARASP
ncbi:PREDICTED: nicotinate phosphoribosyltransferase isoform X1 [Cercocebus atys]|uniref:nicotinate phosphoribosyltransferase isoform X1 n=1 Tax=Cercocebus atys TaxID=9531 RepID=UPI0005F5896F|nr:PREDICTED: nicotinate phosphoribosyltransferase isoform X1 [Cercocebus atys]